MSSLQLFKCGDPCDRAFSDSRGLTHHRNNCLVYKQRRSAQAANVRAQRLKHQLERSASDHPLAEMPRIAKRQRGTTPDDHGVQPDLPTASLSDTIPTPAPPAGPSSTPSSSLPLEQTFLLPTPPNTMPIDPSSPMLTSEPAVRRPSRMHRLPARYRDLLPEVPPAISSPVVESMEPTPSLPRRVILHAFDSFKTLYNSFGISREYRHRPSYDPDSFVSVSDLSSLPASQNLHSTTEVLPSCGDRYGNSGIRAPPWPWENMSIWRLMSWKLTGSNQKSNAETTRLVRDVLQAPDFNLEDLTTFDASKESQKFDEPRANEDGMHRKISADEWRQTSVEILLPTRQPDGGYPFMIPGFMYRPITSVISLAFSEPIAKFFHLTPFKRVWHPTTGPPQRLYDELYSSDAWIKAHDEIQKQRRTDGCRLERVVAGLMLWSDSMRLAQFGHSTAWPVYLFFGNLSKYVRASPVSGACHPIALIPSLPQDLIKMVKSLSRRKNHADDLAHCKRELFHAVWRVLLDEDFLEAYKNGIVVECYDGIRRRIYPRIFTYSADYPEKILIATIRDKGHCPCPRCFIPKSSFWRVGFVNDIKARISQLRTYFHAKVLAARDRIYRLGRPIKASIVETLLKEHSLVPTVNAFIERLAPLGLDLFPMIVVDLMHEFELGVLKNVLKHLVRILHSLDPLKVAILNERYSATPPFGVDAIRRFPADALEMGHTARHFEDMLQCAIPAFEGLFPDGHDTAISTLLFRLAEFHALAKLRLHTDGSLGLFEKSTKKLGQELRKFANITCGAFDVKELPSEAMARQRRQLAQAEKSGRSVISQSGPRRKTFNLLTYKFHSLGDYVQTIRHFGTTDSYTTQTGELAHRVLKKLYNLSSKRNVAQQLARHHQHLTHVRRQQQVSDPPTFETETETSELDGIPELHHVLSNSPSHTVNLTKFLSDHRARGDPAIKEDFIRKLKDHLLSRLYHYEYDGDEQQFTNTERSHIHFVNNLNRVMVSKTFRVNYTSYDVRRHQDFVRPGHRCTVMTLSREDCQDAHPFWYAHVICAFLIPIVHAAPDARNRSQQLIEVLWVRWLGVQPDYRWGFKEARLPKVGFVPDIDDGAFGFLDPSLVIRACHLIPVFSEGRTDSLLRHGESLARPPGETDDWSAFYINIFADRDMFARYINFGVGHKSQIQSEEKIGIGDEEEEENDTASEDIPDSETESAVSLGDEIEESSDVDADDRDDVNSDEDVGDIGQDVGEDESEDDLDDTDLEDCDSELDFEF